MATNQDYVSYPIALALKKAGFDEPCDHYYSYAKTSKSLHPLIDALPSMWNWNGEYVFEFIHPECSAPTLWKAQKWLRGECGIAINVDAHDGDFYTWEVVFLSNAPQDVVIEASLSEEFSPYVEKLDSYEAALSAGIAAALELIEKKGE